MLASLLTAIALKMSIKPVKPLTAHRPRFNSLPRITARRIYGLKVLISQLKIREDRYVVSFGLTVRLSGRLKCPLTTVILGIPLDQTSIKSIALLGSMTNLTLSTSLINNTRTVGSTTNQSA